MDFLERYFAFFRDHDDGSLETLILIVLLMLVFGFGVGYFHKRTPHK